MKTEDKNNELKNDPTEPTERVSLNQLVDILADYYESLKTRRDIKVAEGATPTSSSNSSSTRSNE